MTRARTNQIKLADIVSVRDFSGVDPTGTADSTVGIQAALNSGAGAVYFPEGQYKVSAPLSIPSNTKVYGDGVASKIFTVATSNSVYSWGNTGLVIFVLDQVSNIKIQDLWIDTSGITNFTFASRAIVAWGCSYIWIEDCKFITCGGATAIINSSHYWVCRNDIYVNPTDNDSHHDGIIDQWWGNSDFTIDSNVLRASLPAVMQYGILVTGAQTNGTTPATCRRFSITNNKVYNCEQVGIRSQGETGNNYDCVIANNVVDTVSDFFGIGLDNTINATVSGNTVYNTYYSGIKVAGTGTGSSNVNIVGNSLYNTVTSSSGTDSNAAISCQEASRCMVSGNTISGSTHPRAIYFSSDCANSRELANQYGEPTLSPAVKSDSGTSVVSFGSYTMTKIPVTNVASVSYGDANYSVSGNVVTVSFEVGPVTSGSGTAEVRLSLPFASNLAVKTDLMGSCATAAGVPAALYGDATNNAALLVFTASGAGTYVFYGSFQYVLK